MYEFFYRLKINIYMFFTTDLTSQIEYNFHPLISHNAYNPWLLMQAQMSPWLERERQHKNRVILANTYSFSQLISGIFVCM